MTKTIILTFTAFLCSAFLFAQDDQETDKGFLAIGAGPSFPLGNFASKSPQNPNAGYATKGFILDLVTFCTKLSDNLGICGKVFGAANKQDNTNNPNGNYAGIWGHGALLVGPYLAINVANSVELGLRPMIGLSDALYDQSGASPITVYALGLDLGVSLRINLTHKIAILVNGDYFSSNPTFKDLGYQQQIRSFGLTFGLGLRLY